MAGDLIIPRCEVYWGDENLTFFEPSAKWPNSDGPQPLVYNVRVSLFDESQTPSGSMEWNPTGLAFQEYKRLVSTKKDQTIIVKYYYSNGPYVAFSFVWAGQEESYGNKMGITVKLRSELDGLCTSFIKNFSQNQTDANSKISISAAVANLLDIYGLTTNRGNQLISTEIMGINTRDNFSKIKVNSNYSEGTTFTQSLENLLSQTGHMVFYQNLVRPGPNTGQNTAPGFTIVPPYRLTDKKIINGKLYSKSYDEMISDASSYLTIKSKREYETKTDLRYLYFLIPSLIGEISKTSEWTPNMVTRRSTKSMRKLSQKVFTQTETGVYFDLAATQQAQQKAQEQANRRQGASGSFPSMTASGMRLEGNEEGELRKVLLEEEKTAKLSTNIFMAPRYVGIKPHDILMIPDLSRDPNKENWEDWIVNSVEYSQSEEGSVFISIEASRVYGLGYLMAKPLIYKDNQVVTNFYSLQRENSLSNYLSAGWTNMLNPSKKANPPMRGGPTSQTPSQTPTQPSPIYIPKPIPPPEPAPLPGSIRQSPPLNQPTLSQQITYQLTPQQITYFNDRVFPQKGGVLVGDRRFLLYLRQYPQYTNPKYAPNGGFTGLFRIRPQKAKIYFGNYVNNAPITW